MAHHTSTPASVLAAPQQAREVVSPQVGYSRQERRHGVYVPAGMDPELQQAAHREARAFGRNVPFRSTRVRKGKKVRRNGAA